jgi:hypothetical protein
MTDLSAAPAPARAGRRGDRWSRLRHGAFTVFLTGTVLTVLLTAYAIAPWDRWEDRSLLWRLTIWVIVVVVAVVVQVRSILASPHPWLRAVQGAMVSVALTLLPFATLYAGMSQDDAAVFTQPLTRVDALYFTVTVFATVGFGDIAPVSETARILVTVQMVADLALLGVIVKVLTGAAQHRRGALEGAGLPADGGVTREG